MNRKMLLRKRTLATLAASVILCLSMFVGIAAIPTGPAWSITSGPPIPGYSDDMASFFQGTSPGGPGEVTDPLANIHENLHSWLSKGVVPSSLRSSEDFGVHIMLGVTHDADFGELSENMKISNVFRFDMGFMVQGFIRNSKDLFRIDAAEYTGAILGDQRIDYNEASGPENPVTDQFYVQSIIENDLQQYVYDRYGADMIIGIVDTGVDFGHTDLSDAYAVNSSGYGTSFDPGGTGIAITDWTGTATTGYLATEGFDFQMWYGEAGGTRYSNTTYDIYSEDIYIGVYGGIISQSGFYKVGIARVPGMFVLFMLVDETTPLVYDTLYIDWDTSWYLTCDYYGYTTTTNNEWDFSDDVSDPHMWGDGSEILAIDFNTDGINDFSLGALSNTFDLFDQINGDLVSGIDSLGRGFAFMYDYDGHGTACAGNAAGRKSVAYDVYGNGTLYETPGTAPEAMIMALKLFTFGDYINCWFWGSGYRPLKATSHPYSTYYSWDHSGYFGYDETNQANVLSNSWGMIGTFLGSPYDFIWGGDWYSYTIDFLSAGGMVEAPCINSTQNGLSYTYNSTGWSWIDYYIAPYNTTWGGSVQWYGDDFSHTIDGELFEAPLFVVSMGNAGPGYGTGGAPASYTALMVGASTTAHYAQPFYNNDSSLGAQPVDQIADFSSCGPTPYGLAKPDVVAPGAYAFSIAPLWTTLADGLDAWTTFGGTSQSAPLTAGVVALVMEAAGFTGVNMGITKAMIEAGCDDLNQPAFRQGAGRINAAKSVAIAEGDDQVYNGTHTFSGYLPWSTSGYTWENWWNIHEPSDFSRGWYMSMWAGVGGSPLYDYEAYEHPSYYVPFVDDGFSAYGKPGDSLVVNISGGTESYELDAINAVWYELQNMSSDTFTSTSVYTTYQIFGPGNFDKPFYDQFMAADYAIIYVSYSQSEFMDLYSLAGQANYVFLHDWNDTNEDGIIQLWDSDNVGEVRRVMYDYSDTNVHQIHVGNPGDQWNGDQNATLYYHDVGNELYLWRDLDVTVTIKLFTRETWDWITTYQYDSGESLLYPWQWEITIDIPGATDPGIYSGFLELDYNSDFHYVPIAIRVDGEVSEDSGPLTFGNLDGHPYDNGAIDGALSLSNRYASGEWRFYWIDVTDDLDTGYNFTTWIMTNVTWEDPETCIDVYTLFGGYGNVPVWMSGAFSSTTEYLGGGWWDGTPTWERQNVLLTDWSWGINSSGSDRGYFGLALHVSEYGGNYIQENFTVTISVVNNVTLEGFAGIPGSTAEIVCSSQGDAVVTADSIWTGPHVEFNASWDQLVVPGFPTIEIKQTVIELLSTVEQEHYGTLSGPVQAGWTPDVNPREAYDYVELLAGQNVYVEIEFGAWTTTEGSALIHDPGDDFDVFVWAPGMAHTYANSLTGATTASGANPEIGTFVAPVSGEYTIGLDYYSGNTAMGWRVYVYAYQAAGVVTDGLWSEMDTQSTNTNAAYDVRARMITGTSLDANDQFSSSSVTNVTVINFFAPVVTVLNPGATVGSTEGPGLVTINWTGSDLNLDETLGYSVEVSNDSGATWMVIVYGTTQTSAVWDPTSAFYGMPPTPDTTPNFLVRVNVTDGRYIASDTCDNAFILAAAIIPIQQPLELFVVIIVVIIVIIILLATCLLKRRQTK